MLSIAAVEHDANACAVAHTQLCAVARQQSIVALLAPIRSQHRLRVAAQNMTGDAHMAALHHHAREFAKDFDQFLKHVMPQQGMPPRRVASAQKKDRKNMNAAGQQ